jgi:hypothetical protein
MCCLSFPLPWCCDCPVRCRGTTWFLPGIDSCCCPQAQLQDHQGHSVIQLAFLRSSLIRRLFPHYVSSVFLRYIGRAFNFNVRVFSCVIFFVEAPKAEASLKCSLDSWRLVSGLACTKSVYSEMSKPSCCTFEPVQARFSDQKLLSPRRSERSVILIPTPSSAHDETLPLTLSRLLFRYASPFWWFCKPFVR